MNSTYLRAFESALYKPCDVQKNRHFKLAAEV